MAAHQCFACLEGLSAQSESQTYDTKNQIEFLLHV